MSGILEGRVALVTGAGNGIGRAIAQRFAAEGALVGVNDFKGEAAAATVALIEAAGGRAEALPGDASVREVVRDMVLGLAARRGRFDIVVNNAAWVRYGPILGIDQKTYDRMTGIGFGGIVWSIQAAAEAMAKGGAIINIASSAAFLGMPNAMLYCGLKAGVTGLTRAAAVELGPQGIRVNAIAPGSTKTEQVAAMLTPEMVAKRLERTPLRRLGEVEDIAEAALFLASDNASWMTGHTMLVDGGVTHAFS
jgi:NAD(P)-dependent dehydrogenase (short-subunit alcohol dehydrogenase family)